MIPSVTYLRLSDVSVICHVTYFQFPIQVCFSMSVRQAAQRRIGWFTQYMGHQTLPKIWVGAFLVCCVQSREMILNESNVKMETRHPVEGYFGNEFPAICNHCGVMAQDLKISWGIFAFLEKRPLTVKFSKLCRKVFTASANNVVVKFREMLPTGNRQNRVLFTKQKMSPASTQTRYCADRAQNRSGPTPNNVSYLRVLQISSKSVHFRWSYRRTREHRQIAR